MREPFFAARLPAPLRRLMSDRRGVVALNFGLMLLPMLGAIGLAIDFGNIMTARTKAQMAADAAALQASGVARDLLKTSDGSASSTAAALAEGKKRGEALFRAHAVAAGLDSYTLSLTLTRNGQTIETRTAFSVETKTFIGKVFGRTAFGAVGEAVAASSMPTYSDVYLALDISQSMGIASTQDGMNTLFAARVKKLDGAMVPTECVFGCHTVEPGMAESNSTVAKRYGVQLRIDVLRDAVIKMISTAAIDAENTPIYRIGLYAMGMKATYTSPDLIELSPPSNTFPALKAVAQTIDLGPAPGNSYSDSYINENLQELAKKVPQSYDGSSQSKSKKYAFIITDGVRDIQSNLNCVKTGNRCVSVVSSQSCEEMKKNGVTVGVLYTTYEPIKPIASGTNWYTVQVVNTGVAAGISDALKACASPNWFYQASDATGIAAAMDKMFAQTSSAPRLTN